MNLNDNKFFNSTDIHVSSRMNEYLKKNFGYEVDGDMATLEEAKQSLQLEQVELKIRKENRIRLANSASDPRLRAPLDREREHKLRSAGMNENRHFRATCGCTYLRLHPR